MEGRQPGAALTDSSQAEVDAHRAEADEILAVIKSLGGNVLGLVVLIELAELKGRDLMGDVEVHSLLRY